MIMIPGDQRLADQLSKLIVRACPAQRLHDVFFYDSLSPHGDFRFPCRFLGTPPSIFHSLVQLVQAMAEESEFHSPSSLAVIAGGCTCLRSAASSVSAVIS